MSEKGTINRSERVLLEGANWKHLRFYQKAEALYQMTFAFCERFLPHHGDRTVDQMVQAARSGKQNIIEGLEDGKTSTEMELKLLNVARSSIHELREDYKDFLLSRKFSLWDFRHPRYEKMHAFTRAHNLLADYEPFFRTMDRRGNGEYWLHPVLPNRRDDERLPHNPRKPLPHRRRHEGTHAPIRTGYRAEQDRKMQEMEATIKWQAERIKELEERLEEMRNEK